MKSAWTDDELVADGMILEPVIVGVAGVDCYRIYLSPDRNHGLGYVVETTDGGICLRIAERMVAAWNACSGFPTNCLVPGYLELLKGVDNV